MLTLSREILPALCSLHARPRGRMVAITGARQTGKSTLARMAFPDYPLVNLDSPQERAQWERLGPEGWIARMPRAIIDEAQKLPSIFDTLKACYDRDPSVRYVLLGSSQILLMSRIRESMAGRVALTELFPLTLPELLQAPGLAMAPPESLLVRLLRADRPAAAVEAELAVAPILDARVDRARAAWERFLAWGGMPVLTHAGYDDEDRFAWLQDYQATYLQRDLADLARLDRLEPFARAQQAAAMRVSRPLNYAELGRLSGVSAPTAQQYMRYLEVSYQVLRLPAWFRNPEKRLARQEKLHFLDPGVHRALLKRRGLPDGFEVENAVVAEVAKQARTHRLPVELSYLRTYDGREVDLLIELDAGFVAIEVKSSLRVGSEDVRHLRDLDRFLDKPLLLGLVVSHDPVCAPLEREGAPLWKVEAARLFT